MVSPERLADEAVRVMAPLIQEGYSLGYAKTQAIRKLKLDKAAEKVLVKQQAYIDLKSSFLTQDRKNKSWWKK